MTDIATRLINIDQEFKLTPEQQNHVQKVAADIRTRLCEEFGSSQLSTTRTQLDALIRQVADDLAALASKRTGLEAAALLALKASKSTTKIDEQLDAIGLQQQRLQGRKAALESELAALRDIKDGRAEAYHVGIEAAYKEQFQVEMKLREEAIAKIAEASAEYRLALAILRELSTMRTYYSPATPPQPPRVIDLWAERKPEAEIRPPEAGLGLCTLPTNSGPCTGDLYVSHEGSRAEIRCYRCGQCNESHPMMKEFAAYASAEAAKLVAV